MNFEQLKQRTRPFEEFELKWRFTEDKYNVLPIKHLSEVKVLDNEANEMFGNFLFEGPGLIGQYKLNNEQFDSILEFDLRTKSKSKTKKWLDGLNIDPNETVFLYWNSWGSVFTKWEIFKLYYDDFYYPVSDDLIITNINANWLLYFFHEEHVYFGLRK